MAARSSATTPERRAQAVLRQFGIDAPPIPVEDLVVALGADLSKAPLEGDISGMLFREDEPETRAVIGVNSADALTRQRFTIAHEIGHLLMHPGRPVIIDKLVRLNLRTPRAANLASSQEEREANRFAAELLMPEDMVREATGALVGDRELVSDRWLVQRLAKLFDVSGQAMEYRLVNLHLLSPLALQSG
jgi:hypothetical protein